MNKITIGITGQNGFVGYHLINTIGVDDRFESIPFERRFFENSSELENFVSKCDVIVHLAALNRHESHEFLYATNVELVQKLISACENTGSNPHILFSSSSQEGRENSYADSKVKGRELFEDWARRNKNCFTALVVPNVFGAFGRPNYNSVVATFCHKLINNEKPEIHVDADLKLIYVNKLIEEIIKSIVESKGHDSIYRYEVPFQYEAKVSRLLEILSGFRDGYLKNGLIPDLKDGFTKDLFNTFRTYIPDSFFPFKYVQHSDDRGAFVEIARTTSSGQFSFSTTVPGITRGNHFHTRKAERFAVIKGKAIIELRRMGSKEKVSYELNGDEPSFVDMPIWTTHNITNIGDEELITLFWINEPYDPDDPDTYFVEV